jgi:hypothetical protein
VEIRWALQHQKNRKAARAKTNIIFGGLTRANAKILKYLD